MTGSTPPLRRRRLRTTVVAIVGLVVLSLLVLLHLTEGIDDAVKEWARPDNVWGPRQQQVNLLLEQLGSGRILALLVLAGLAVSWRRRTVRPAFLTAVGAASVVCLVVGLKLVVRRPDTELVLDALGSFPSGHVASATAAAGAMMMMVDGGGRLLMWTAAFVGGVAMSFASIVVGVHWLTDVIGGLLVGCCALAAVSGLDAVLDAGLGTGPDPSG